MKRITLLLASAFLVLSVIPTLALAQPYTESPMLAEKVAAGELPPIDERLPAEPFVIDSGILMPEDALDWQPGRHGGTLRVPYMDPGWSAAIFLMNVEPILVPAGIDTRHIHPNLVSDYAVSEDNRVFTFTLREGLRWSDGHPVTTEDVRFAYEDVMLNEDLTPAFPAKYRSAGRGDGTPMELNIIDDGTFEIVFDEPYGSFLTAIAITGWAGYTELIKPKHVLTPYHINYTSLDDMADELAEEELDQDQWYVLFNTRDVTHWELTQPQAVGFPVLYPWMQVESPSGVMEFHRNPYYHKVDTEGSQLPYIDRIVGSEATSLDIVNVRLAAGEIDYFYEAALQHVDFYMANRDSGNYEVHIAQTPGTRTFFLNFNYDDPVWQEVVGDVRFRQALNMAIDNQEVIDSVLFGFAVPVSTIPNVYDPEQAQALLDEMGMDQMDSEGFRLAPDGSQFTIHLEFPDIGTSVPTAELLVEYFNAVGVRTQMRVLSAELWSQRAQANELMATLHWPGGSMTQWRDQPAANYIPTMHWGPLWQQWYVSGGETGEEPPEEFKRLFSLREERIAAVTHSEEDLALQAELEEIFYEYLPMIFVFEDHGDPVPASRNLRNVPEEGSVWEYALSAEQLFFAE